MLWTRNKAQDLANKAKGKKFIGPPTPEAFNEALDLANRQPFDYAGKHTAYATHEQIPGTDREFTRALLNAPQSVQDAYSLDPRSTWRGPGNRDLIYGGLRIGDTPMGMLVAPTSPMQGVWQGSGGLQLNRGEVARPLVGLLPKEGTIDPASRALLEGGELTRAYLDAQAAGAAHVLFPKVSAGKMGSIDIPMKRPLTRDEADKLVALAKRYGFSDISDRGSGVTITNFGAEPQGKRVGKILKDPHGFRAELEKILPDAGKPTRVGVDSVYQGFTQYPKVGEGPPLETLAYPGSGHATRLFLDQLDQMPGVRDALIRNRGIPLKALANMERDEAWAKSLGATAPRDIQNARQIISQGGDWPARLRAALARGEVLPAVAAALLTAALAGGESSQQ